MMNLGRFLILRQIKSAEPNGLYRGSPRSLAGTLKDTLIERPRKNFRSLDKGSAIKDNVKDTLWITKNVLYESSRETGQWSEPIMSG